MGNLSNKRILLGVTGGVAAYKSADLIRRLVKAGCEVRVAMTQSAKEFISPITLQALSGNPIHDDLFDPEQEAAMGHIACARWADLILIAPASANFMAKLCHGQADNLLSAICLASRAIQVLAPAMNQQMWQNPATQSNLQQLQQRGFHIVGPDSGEQACGEVGPGRLLEPEAIVLALEDFFETQQLSGQRVLITAGPTREAIDPVRYLSNHSSGKMGYALAEAAALAGAKVQLISGPTQLACPDRVERIDVITAEQMSEAVLSRIDSQTIFIAAAAVADFRPAILADQKIKKSANEMTLTLVRNPDILKTVGERDKKPFTVGFAAETENLLANAQKKLNEKQCDMVVANQVGIPGSGFDSDENALTLVFADRQIDYPQASKRTLAREIINHIATHTALSSSRQSSTLRHSREGGNPSNKSIKDVT